MAPARHILGRQPPTRRRDDPRLPIALGLAVMLSSALWGWSFMLVAGVGLALTAVGAIAWRHRATTMQRWALWLSLAALIISLFGRLSLLPWERVATKQITWQVIGEAGAGAHVAVGQKRIELHLRLHPGYVHTVYSTPLATALRGSEPAMRATFAVSRTIWGLGRARLVSLGAMTLCANQTCPPATVPIAGGRGGWQGGRTGPSPWR